MPFTLPEKQAGHKLCVVGDMYIVHSTTAHILGTGINPTSAKGNSIIYTIKWSFAFIFDKKAKVECARLRDTLVQSLMIIIFLLYRVGRTFNKNLINLCFQNKEYKNYVICVKCLCLKCWNNSNNN